MSAYFNSFVTQTSSSIRVLYYEADINDIEIVNVGDAKASSWASNNRYGINGTFYARKDFTMGFAINAGNHITENYRNYDAANDWVNYKRPYSCLLSFNSTLPSSSTFLALATCQGLLPFTYSGDSVQLSNIKWGVGGINLYVNDSSITSETALINRIKSDVDAVTESQFRTTTGYDDQIQLRNPLARTAIGYKAPGKVVLAIFVNPNSMTDAAGVATAYQVRQIMKNELNCTMGLLLDGGNSTQMSYKKNSSATSIVVKNPCYTRIGLKSNTSITWDWNATV